MKEIEKVHADLQRDLAQAKAADVKASACESEQLHQLHSRLETVQAQLTTYHKSQARALDTHRLALAVLGEQEYRGAVARIEDLQRDLERARQSVLTAQLALDAYLEEATAKLTDWPELQRKIVKHLSPVDDATARIMRSALQYTHGMRNEVVENRESKAQKLASLAGE